MKTKLWLFLLLSFSCYLLSSQVPQGFNYQAIARDGSGNALPGEALQVKIFIQSDSLGGTVFWEELHSAVTTNDFGGFSLFIGKGERQESSFNEEFSEINWSITPKFIKTSIYYDNAWFVMGSSRLLSVPYSMVAGNLNDTLDKLIVKGTTADLEEPLFEVKNNFGQTIFAVYNEGVRVYVSDGDTKGKKGGFAIGGFNKAKDGINQDYFIVNRDSVRIYLDTNSVKVKKGGFAIGGFNPSKTGGGEEFLRVTRDSTQINFSNTPSKVKKGGFAIGGFDPSKGIIPPVKLLTVSDDSIRMYIREEAKAAKGGFAIGGYGNAKDGANPVYMSVLSSRTNIQVTDTLKGFSVTNIQGGGASDLMRIDKINAFIGHETGPLTAPNPTGDEGKFNIFIGYQSGNKNISGYKNVFLGYNAGMMNKTAEHNVFIGTESGICDSTDGRYNTFVGSQTGVYNTASENTFIGYSAGVLNETGEHNTFLGTNSGAFHTSGDNNTFLGWGSGNNNSGENNVFIGSSAGSSNVGTGNVYIGFNANLAGSNKLLITNSSNIPNVPLIYGEFNNKFVTINDVLKITPRAAAPTTPAPTEGTLYVNSTDHHIYCYLNNVWVRLD